VRLLAGLATGVLACAAMGDGPSPAVREKTLASYTPQHVIAVYRATVWHSICISGSSVEGATEEESAVFDAWRERFDPPREAMAAYLDDAMPDKSWTGVTGSNISTPASMAERSQRMLEGVAPVPDVHFLAAFDPRFDEDPLAEMTEGVTRTYTSDGSGASDGLRFEFEAPLSWLPGHVRGGGAVKRLVSEAGAGLASFTLTVVPLAQEDDRATADDLAGKALDETAHPDREKLTQNETSMLGVEAMSVSFADSSSSRYGQSRSIEKHYLCNLDGRAVKFEFSVADRARSVDALLSEEILRAEFDRLEPLFDEIVKRAKATPER